MIKGADDTYSLRVLGPVEKLKLIAMSRAKREYSIIEQVYFGDLKKFPWGSNVWDKSWRNGS